ncbi:hypothetical protein I7412_17240, partial [Frankia sp. CN6]
MRLPSTWLPPRFVVKLADVVGLHLARRPLSRRGRARTTSGERKAAAAVVAVDLPAPMRAASPTGAWLA